MTVLSEFQSPAAPAVGDGERFYAAVHEAGHAVMSFLLDVGVVEVNIEPAEDRLGVCHNAGWPDWCEREAAPQDEGRRLVRRLLIEKHILVTLAGPEAESRVRGAYNSAGAARDESTARLLAGLVAGPTDEEIRAFTAWLRIRTARHLDRAPVWRAVEVVARGLLERTRLTGEEAESLHAAAIAAADPPRRGDGCASGTGTHLVGGAVLGRTEWRTVPGVRV